MSKAGPPGVGNQSDVRSPPDRQTRNYSHLDDVSVVETALHQAMDHPCLIAFVLTTSVHLPTALSITAPRNFRRHIGAPAPPTDWDLNWDWENGLRAAVYQMLIREGYTHPDLREHLSIAPVLGQTNTNTATPFGDIAVLARGQLYLTNAGFAFIQDPNNYDCDECDKQQICGAATSCRWSKPQPYGTLLALWTARRIRHRDRNYGHRYEVQYTISPIRSDSSGTFILKNGLFNYDIAGHVFASVKDSGCKWCNHQRENNNYVPAILTQQSHGNVKNDRGYLPPDLTVMEVKPAVSKGGFVLGMNPNDDGKYALHSLPKQEEAHGYHRDDLQKEIELYTRLLQSLATQRPPVEYNTTPSPGMTKFIPSTTHFAFVRPMGSPSTSEKEKTTVPYYKTTFSTDLGGMPKETSTMQLRPVVVTTPSTLQLHGKTSVPPTTTPFKASPNYIRYSEPDPLYPPAPMMYTTNEGRKQFFSTSQKTTATSPTPTIIKQKSKHKVYLKTANNASTMMISLTTPPAFEIRKITDVQHPSKANKQHQGNVVDYSKQNKTKQPQENVTETRGAMIPHEQQTSVTSATAETETKYEEVVKSTAQQQQETTTTSNEDSTESVATTERESIRQEAQRNLSTMNEIIQTQDTLTSIPDTTTNVNEDDRIQTKFTTLVTEDDGNKNAETPTTVVTFFAGEDLSTESSTPEQKQTIEYTTIQKETTDLPPKNLYDLESTTAGAQTENSEIPANTETLQPTTTDGAITRTDKEINLLDEIFGTVVTDRALKSSTTMHSATKLKNTKEIDEVFDGELLTDGVSDSTQRNLRIIFSNFYFADPTTTEPTTDSHSESENQEGYTTETIAEETDSFSEHTTQPTTTEIIRETESFSDYIDYTTQPVTVIPTSQSYSTSITFEVNKKSSSPSGANEKVKARLTEIKLNDTQFMIYKAELPEKKAGGKEVNAFDSIALMLVNHAKSIDYVHGKRNETKPPKRKHHRKQSKRHQKKIT